MKRVELEIEGMTCEHCSGRVEKALREVTGVDAVTVDLAEGRASLDVEGVEAQTLIDAVERAGYGAKAG